MTEHRLTARYKSNCYVCQQPMEPGRSIMWDRAGRRGRHMACEPLVAGVAAPVAPVTAPTLARNRLDDAHPRYANALVRLRTTLAELIGLGCPEELFEAALGAAIGDVEAARERHVREALEEHGNGGISLEEAGLDIPFDISDGEAREADRVRAESLAQVLKPQNDDKHEFAGLAAWLDGKD